MENFDEDVRSRLKFSRDKTIECLSQREQWLLALTRVELDGEAEFDPDMPRFHYTGPLALPGWYNLDWKAADAADEHFYRPDHALAVRLIERAVGRDLPAVAMTLDYTNHPSKISVVEPLVGQSGWLEVSKVTVTAVEVDEYLILAAQTDHNQTLDEEICRKLLSLPAHVESNRQDAKDAKEGEDLEKVGDLGDLGGSSDLADLCSAAVQEKLQQIESRNGQFFDEEVLKLDRWSEDLKLSLEREIKEIDKLIRELRRTAVLAQSLQDKLACQKQIRNLERRRNAKRRELFDAQDAIDGQREELIGKIEKQLQHTTTVQALFTIRWTVR